MTEPDFTLSFECPNCKADIEFDGWTKTTANQSHPWADYKIEKTTCLGCGERVTLQLRGLVLD
jgi:hypothetical protein